MAEFYSGPVSLIYFSVLATIQVSRNELYGTSDAVPQYPSED